MTQAYRLPIETKLITPFSNLIFNTAIFFCRRTVDALEIFTGLFLDEFDRAQAHQLFAPFL